MGEVRRYFSTGNWQRRSEKTGLMTGGKCVTSYQYTCKLHHPDAAEIELMRVELSTGMTQKAVAAAHGMDRQRLLRVLKKAAPPRPPPRPPRPPPEPFTEDERQELLAMLTSD